MIEVSVRQRKAFDASFWISFRAPYFFWRHHWKSIRPDSHTQIHIPSKFFPVFQNKLAKKFSSNFWLLRCFAVFENCLVNVNKLNKILVPSLPMNISYYNWKLRYCANICRLVKKSPLGRRDLGSIVSKIAIRWYSNVIITVIITEKQIDSRSLTFMISAFHLLSKPWKHHPNSNR
jgi:hypothetical protein